MAPAPFCRSIPIPMCCQFAGSCTQGAAASTADLWNFHNACQGGHVRDDGADRDMRRERELPSAVSSTHAQQG